MSSSEKAKEEDDGKNEPEQTKHARIANDKDTDALPLDWTRVDVDRTATEKDEEDDHHSMSIRHPWDVADISNDDTDICIVGTAGQKITIMGSELGEHCCAPQRLKQLILRSHLIRKMEGLSEFVTLELLELYDNMIEELQCLNEGKGGAPGRTLRILDMSYNSIRNMAPVQFCPNLTELYLANNKLKTMAGLRGLTQLRKIDLGANRIRVMDQDELSGLVNLEELWIGKNKIEEIQGLEKLTKLRRLDIQSNRLTRVANLSSQVDSLEELYLAHNGINDDGAAGSDKTGLALPFGKLTTLDLSRNCLTTTAAMAHMITLEDLWLSGNKIASFAAVEPLSVLGRREGARLEELYLEYNPVASEFEYRKKLKEIIPSLQKIDATMIGGLAGGGVYGMSSTVSGATTTTTTTGAAMTREEELRRMQEQVVARARMESEEKQEGET